MPPLQRGFRAGYDGDLTYFFFWNGCMQRNKCLWQKARQTMITWYFLITCAIPMIKYGGGQYCTCNKKKPPPPPLQLLFIFHYETKQIHKLFIVHVWVISSFFQWVVKQDQRSWTAPWSVLGLENITPDAWWLLGSPHGIGDWFSPVW